MDALNNFFLEFAEKVIVYRKLSGISGSEEISPNFFGIISRSTLMAEDGSMACLMHSISSDSTKTESFLLTKTLVNKTKIQIRFATLEEVQKIRTFVETNRRRVFLGSVLGNLAFLKRCEQILIDSQRK